MKITNASSLSSRKPSDLLILPFWKVKDKAVSASKLGKLEQEVKQPLDLGDFDGTLGQFVALYTGGKSEPRIALVGLGEEEDITTERLRRASNSVVGWCHQHGVKNVSYLFHSVNGMTEPAIVRGVTEGILLGNYNFTAHKTPSKTKKDSLIESFQLIDSSAKGLQVAKEAAEIARSVYHARDLVNSNADLVTPQYLAATAKKIAKENHGVTVKVLSKKEIEKEKMGLLLAVNRGAHHDPVFIILSYKGAPKSKDHTVLVGKGITYDTGGLNLKPTGSMETMKCDMGGSATALATIEAAARLKLKVNITAVVASTENSIDANSYKPGDVYTSYQGTTVEIGNTDAEGRLVLADALAYANKNLKPTRMIDFATLTGAIVVALGDEVAGVFSNNDALADAIIRSGIHTFERCWRLPIFDDYRKQLDSKIADIKNTGGRAAGSITAALFLKEFTGDTPWAHVDIAGTAYLDKPKYYHPANATGFGVRLMIDFLKNL